MIVPATLCAVLVGVGSASRDVVSFDFGWKHRTGLAQSAPVDSWCAPNTKPNQTNPNVRLKTAGRARAIGAAVADLP